MWAIPGGVWFSKCELTIIKLELGGQTSVSVSFTKSTFAQNNMSWAPERLANTLQRCLFQDVFLNKAKYTQLNTKELCIQFLQTTWQSCPDKKTIPTPCTNTWRTPSIGFFLESIFTRRGLQSSLYRKNTHSIPESFLSYKNAAWWEKHKLGLPTHFVIVSLEFMLAIDKKKEYCLFLYIYMYMYGILSYAGCSSNVHSKKWSDQMAIVFPLVADCFHPCHFCYSCTISPFSPVLHTKIFHHISFFLFCSRLI